MSACISLRRLSQRLGSIEDTTSAQAASIRDVFVRAGLQSELFYYSSIIWKLALGPVYRNLALIWSVSGEK